ncbi:MAG: alpha/beta hydrolase, partial [Polaromonas sp.]|nr:alpha/beta hydrolase [Polaromonas sp.]
MNYAAPWWLPGGNLQTIWAALRSRRYLGPQPLFRRERWTTPDEDFVDVDWLIKSEAISEAGTAATPLLVVFHGLEGSAASHYAEALADAARERGWACAIPHFRGCSGELNLAPRAYHSGDFAEIDWILRRFAEQHSGPVVAVGISLGGNALMCWAGEIG